MSYYLSESVTERVNLLKKICNLFFEACIEADEAFYILDLLIVADLVKQYDELNENDAKMVDYLSVELAYYQPDEETRLESDLLYWEEQLKIKLEKALSMSNMTEWKKS